MNDERPTPNELARQCADLRDELAALRKDFVELRDEFVAKDIAFTLLSLNLGGQEVADAIVDAIRDRAWDAIERKIYGSAVSS